MSSISLGDRSMIDPLLHRGVDAMRPQNIMKCACLHVLSEGVGNILLGPNPSKVGQVTRAVRFTKAVHVDQQSLLGH